MTRTQANNGFDFEELAPALTAALEELGEAIEAGIRAALAEAEEQFEADDAE